MTVVVQTDMCFDLLQDEAKARWWAATQERARAAVMMDSGTRIYVTESVDAILALTGRATVLLDLHVVSVATGSMYETRRTVHAPALRRLIPVAKVSSIAPIVDAEIAEQVPA